MLRHSRSGVSIVLLGLVGYVPAAGYVEPNAPVEGAGGELPDVPAPVAFSTLEIEPPAGGSCVTNRPSPWAFRTVLAAASKLVWSHFVDEPGAVGAAVVAFAASTGG